MKNKLLKLSSLLFALAAVGLTGCNNESKEQTPTEPEIEEIEKKKSFGKDALFDESTGYQNEDPCVLEVNANTRYVYYTRNIECNKGSDECICFKKGIYSGGTWSYSKTSVVLRKSENGWDSKHVYAPSVIKGDFIYKNKMYRYLMAYAGTNEENRASSQIGFALSVSPDSEFIKVEDKAFVTYDKNDWTSGVSTAEGVSNPSLVSKDGSSQVWLFYSHFSPITTACTRVIEFDLSNDMSALETYSDIEGMIVNNKGIFDASEVPELLGADFAFEPYSDTLYSVTDYYPIAAGVKPNKSSSVSLYKSNFEDVIYTVPSPETEINGWEALGKVVQQNTKGTEAGMIGYSRIYSAAIVKDGYGHVEVDDGINVVVTVSPTSQQDSTYVFNTQFIEVKIELGGER